MKRKEILRGLGGLVITLSAYGCGGSTADNFADRKGNAEGGGFGRAVLTILWPSQSRFIHNAADRLRAIVRNGGATVATKEASKPDGQIVFDRLPLYPLDFEIQAYRSDNNQNGPGSPFVMSRAKLTITLKPGGTTQLDFTLADEADHVEITPGSFTLAVGETRSIQAQSKTQGGAIVVSGAGDFIWTSDNPAIASVDANGLVTGHAAGTTAVVAQERGNDTSGKSARASVGVSTPAPPPPGPEDLVVDDLQIAPTLYDLGFNRWGNDPWFEDNTGGYKDHYWWTYSKLAGEAFENAAQWHFNIPADRNYEVFAYIPNTGNARTGDAEYEVWVRSEKRQTVFVNQLNNVGTWVSLGTYFFPAGDGNQVRLLDRSSQTDKFRIAFDAVKFSPR